jgi:short-subunit dehydrogenase
MKLKDAVVIVTGASSGIGKATALLFDKMGAKVSMVARREEKLEDNAKKMSNALVLPADLSNEKQAEQIVTNTISKYGRVDVLINNAAAIIVSDAESVKPEELRRAFQTNLIGSIIATNKAVEYMKKQGYGHIINVGSPGFMIGVPFYTPYVTTKASMSAWTRTLQAEWANSEIKVSEYFPGYIKTESSSESKYGSMEQDLLMDEDQNPISRFFNRPKTPEHVAKQLVRLVKKPKLIAYSGFMVRIGAFLSNFSGIRHSISVGMAETARKKLASRIKESKQ